MKRWIHSTDHINEVSVTGLYPGLTVREVGDSNFKIVESIQKRDKGYLVTFDDGSESLYDVGDKFIRQDQDITGSDSMEEDDWKFDPFRGRTYRISGGYSDTKYTNYPKNAIEYWFKMQNKYPSDVMILAKKKADAQKLVDYVASNEGYIRELNHKYPTPYKIDYIINESIKKSEDGCKWFHEGPYGDAIHPFSVG